MSLQPHLESSPLAIDRILTAVNGANLQLPVALSKNNVTAGVPSPMPIPTASGINTALTLSAITTSGYTDAITVYYPRTDIGQAFTTAGIAPAIDFTNVTTWAGLFNTMNLRYNTSFTTVDYPTTAFAPSSPLTVTLPASSLLYTGSFTVRQSVKYVQM